MRADGRHGSARSSTSRMLGSDPHWSSQYGVWMPKAMRVVGGVYIHEVPLTTDGRRLGVSEVGTPASHGCIRVPVGAAGRLYDWARIGTPVIVH